VRHHSKLPTLAQPPEGACAVLIDRAAVEAEIAQGAIVERPKPSVAEKGFNRCC
jgi:hypothetical protein